MSQSGTCECPICFNSMESIGEHQPCAILCGHVFCKSCAFQWVSNHHNCPICNKNCSTADIITIFWPQGNPIDNSLVNSLEQKIAELKEKNEAILGKFKNLYDHTSDLQASALLELPGLLFEKDVQESYRVKFSKNHIIVTTKQGEWYGVEFSETSSFKKWNFIPICKLQIRDICISPDLIDFCFTVSHDSTYSFIQLKEGVPPIVRSLPEIPWSCIWPTHDKAFIGATKGTIFVIDAKYATILAKVSIGGPQFFSLASINSSKIAAVNAKFIFIFDVGTNSFEETRISNTSQLLAQCSDSTLIAAVNQKEERVEIGEVRGGFILRAAFGTGRLNRLAKADIVHRGGSVIIAAPDADGFTVRRLSQPQKDLWGEFRDRWAKREEAGPVMDLALTREGDLILAVCTPWLLRIFSLPFS